MSACAAEAALVSDVEPTTGAGADWERRRRLAAVFGDALPDTTADERDPEAGARDTAAAARGESAAEAWLKAQVPPHHG